MTRFEPEGIAQALLRFFDMAAPDANVYVEIPAPDIRFAAIVLLAVAAIVCFRRLGPGRRPTFAMLGLLLLSAALWLGSTGNGRYFMAMLVCAGPIAIALACLLPLTRAYKALIAALLVATQGYLLVLQNPWDNWPLVHWTGSGYFPVDVGSAGKDGPPTTYATLSLITYSLMAPQFPERSRWINLSTNSGTPRDDARIDAFLREAAAAGPVRLLAPSSPSATRPDGQPTAEIVRAFGLLIAQRNLRISGDCSMLASEGIGRMMVRDKRVVARDLPPAGFWSCPLAYEPNPSGEARTQAVPEPVARVYARFGELCPRFFPPVATPPVHLKDAWERHYPGAETRVYVLDNGEVWYKFWRSFNPEYVGKADDIVAGRTGLDCSRIRGADGAWRTGAAP